MGCFDAPGANAAPVDLSTFSIGQYAMGAELVKQLSPEMQAKIVGYRSPEPP
jgi:hypothetical protein